MFASRYQRVSRPHLSPGPAPPPRPQLASLALFVYLFNFFFASPLQPPSVHTGKRITLYPSVERIEVGRGEGKSNKIIEHGEESHFPPAIPSLGRIIAGILELG